MLQKSRTQPYSNLDFAEAHSVTAQADVQFDMFLVCGGSPSCLGNPPRQVLWTHVPSVQGFLNDVAQQNQYRPLASHYRRFMIGGLSPDLGPIVVGPVDPPDEEWCPLCPQLFDVPLLAVNPPELSFARSVSGSTPVELTPQARTRVSLPGVSWIAAAEPRAWAPADAVLFAALTPDAVHVASALGLSGGRLESVLARGRTEVPPCDCAFTDASVEAEHMHLDVPEARSEHGTVLSASERSVFVVGGVLADGTFAGDFLQVELETGLSRTVTVMGEAPRRVLAATYRPLDRSLYIVDHVKKQGKHRARLLRISIDTGEGELLGHWPRNLARDKVFLTVGPRSELVLTGASSGNQKFKTVLLSVDGTDVEARRIVKGKANIAFAPRLGGWGLTIPVKKQARIENEVVFTKDFGPGGTLQVVEDCL